jgi:hypothetical protein
VARIIGSEETPKTPYAPPALNPIDDRVVPEA